MIPITPETIHLREVPLSVEVVPSTAAVATVATVAQQCNSILSYRDSDGQVDWFECRNALEQLFQLKVIDAGSSRVKTLLEKEGQLVLWYNGPLVEAVIAFAEHIASDKPMTGNEVQIAK